MVASKRAESQESLPVIAIDGPAASGKSTVAASVAERIGVPWFDTGLLYRAVARCAVDSQTASDDVEALVACAQNLDLETMSANASGALSFAEGLKLRAPEIDATVSHVSAHPEVRAALFQKQRTLAERRSLVMVGRDITTVVAPDAVVRVFLDASPEVRAKRRTADLRAQGEQVAESEVLATLIARDRSDSNREAAPLKIGDGVAVIDTDNKTVEQITDEIENLWRSRSAVNSDAKPSRDQASNAALAMGKSELPDWSYGATLSRRRRFVNASIGRALRGLTGLYAEGRDNIPSSGPLLFVSNHLHNADPALEYYVYPRPLHFMGKQELFRFPIVKQIAEISGGFPVDRGKVDRDALRNVEERLANGITVGIYPEGGRSPTGALIEAKPGAGLLALKNGVPLLPVAITGSERLPFNGKKGAMQAKAEHRDPGHSGVRVVFGKPFCIPREFKGRKIGSAEATEIIMLEIARLLPDAYQGAYREILTNEPERRILPYDSSTSSGYCSSP